MIEFKRLADGQVKLTLGMSKQQESKEAILPEKWLRGWNSWFEHDGL